MATVVGAPVGSGNIAQNFANAGQGIGSIVAALAQKRNEQKRQQDLQLLTQTLNPQALEQNAPGVGPPAPQPQIDLSQLGGLQTPGFQNLASQLMIQRAFQDEQGDFTLGIGDKRFTKGGQLKASGPAKIPTAIQKKQSESVITDPSDPNKAIRVRSTFDAEGNVTNQTKIGEATLAEKIGGVASEALESSTKGKLEKDVIDLSQTLTELGSLQDRMGEDAFGGDFTFDDFFTFKGKGQAYFTDLGKQLGISPSEANKKFLSAKTTFGADAKRVFLKFRKFITGVAGGAKEFKEIAKAAIDPDKGSSITFKARFDSMRDSALRTQNMLLAMRNSGLDPNSKTDRLKAFNGKSLSDIPLEVKPNVTLDTITKQPDSVAPANFNVEDLPNLTDEQLDEMERQFK